MGPIEKTIVVDPLKVGFAMQAVAIRLFRNKIKIGELIEPVINIYMLVTWL